MTNSLKRPTGSRSKRGAATAAALALSLAVVSGCSDDSAGPEAGGVTVEDLQGLEEQVGGLEERIGTLEEEAAAGPVDDGEEVAGAEEEEVSGAEALVGRQGTVSAEISELITTTDVGGAFRIAGEGGGEPVAVISATPPPTLDESDLVRVSGTIHLIQRDSFEEDFGVAEEDLFEDPDAFFETEEGQPAIAASEIEVLQEQAED